MKELTEIGAGFGGVFGADDSRSVGEGVEAAQILCAKDIEKAARVGAIEIGAHDLAQVAIFQPGGEEAGVGKEAVIHRKDVAAGDMAVEPLDEQIMLGDEGGAAWHGSAYGIRFSAKA